MSALTFCWVGVGRIQVSWEPAEAISLMTGPFAGTVPGVKVAVNQKVMSNLGGPKSRDGL